MNTRAIAAKILTEVIREQRSLTELLSQNLSQQLSNQDQSLIKEYCFGTLRWFHRLKIIVDSLLYKPIQAKNFEILSLILLGLYQLIYLRTPAHAAVSETVAAAKSFNKTWAKGLINQALNQFLRKPDFFLSLADQTMAGKFSHPLWFIAKMKQSWPEDWEKILEANNEHPPMFLRVNLQKNSRKEYLQKLSLHQIEAEEITHLLSALKLKQPIPVKKLPDFENGCCSVQDLASQYLSVLLDPKPAERVLDACAAPGGKTGLILEKQPQAELIAIDQDPNRLALAKENITRLAPGSSIKLFAADAVKTDQWWDGQPFDYILLDPPCSGTGVIRRHPDIKILRRPEDIPKYIQQQQALLHSLWPLLKSGGHLLYSTCSVLPEENEEMMTQFCQNRTDLQIVPIEISTGLPQKIGRQLLPTIEGHDGFYYALLKKV